MNESGLKPRFEEEFPDAEHPERDELNADFETGQINAIQAGYVEPATAKDITLPALIPKTASDKPSHPDRPLYRGGHPIKVKGRVLTAGDANSGDPDFR